ncbi:binding protein [Actinidia rufa]|uniref:Binding protein n=1 Tax=Actinidia rufa TaxID=165716 RepID=A0A7J0E1V3_9ERIC|nr:binding protein [Actinidia rufa]GFY80489.1 binding protein [Actinidia rufa]
MDDQEEMEDEDANMNYRDPSNRINDPEDEGEENAQDFLAAAGLGDSDAEDDMPAPSNANLRRRAWSEWRRAWSESDEDEPRQMQPQSSHNGENSPEMQVSDG